MWTLSSAVRKILYCFNSRRLSSITGEHRREIATNPDFDLLTAGHILSIDEDRLLRRTLIAYMNKKLYIFHGCVEMTLSEIVELAQNKIAWSLFINSLDACNL